MSVEFCFILLHRPHLKGDNARDIIRINVNRFIMTNIYMSQLIVTGKQRENMLSLALSSTKSNCVCHMYYVYKLNLDNCSFINILRQ